MPTQHRSTRRKASTKPRTDAPRGFGPEAVMAYFADAGDHPKHVHEIARGLGVGKGETHELRRTLKAMVKEGQLVRARGRTYRSPGKTELLEGRFHRAQGGFGFVSVESRPGKDIFVPEARSGGVMDGDLVKVRLEWEQGNKSLGTIMEVLDRRFVRLTGIAVPRGRRWLLEPDDNKLDRRVHLVVPAGVELRSGAEVGAEMVEYPSDPDEPVVAKVVEVLAPADSPIGVIQRAIFDHRLPTAFPADVESVAQTLPTEVERSEWDGRENLRHLPFVTIDGADARDFDDAVCLVEEGRHNVLYVAIADVAHYVAVATPLDKEARARGTSTYFPRRVVPMLPEALSNELCSLNPEVDRLAVVTKIPFTKSGRAKPPEFLDAVIHSHGRLTYDSVQALFDTEPGQESAGDAAALPPEPVHGMLRDLRTLADTLREQRLKGGSLDLEVAEPQFFLSDDQSKIDAVVGRTRTEATGLIEELMLLSNRSVAEALRKAQIPALYRVHDQPNPEKMETFAVTAAIAGAGGMREKRKGKTAIDPQRILSNCQDGNRRRVLQALLLRALARARYTVEEDEHYGLGFEAYTHSTSPIRRYPDLVVQRLIKRHLVAQFPPRAPGRLLRTLEEIGAECSDLERRAQAAEWDAQAGLKAIYMARHLGETMTGIISGATHGGLFVLLDGLPIDGYLPLRTMDDDWYSFDEDALQFVGERTGNVLKLGDPIEVLIAATNPITRRIDLVPPNSQAARSKARPRKKPAATTQAKEPDPNRDMGVIWVDEE